MLSEKESLEARILIIDDDPNISRLLGASLKSAGYSRRRAVTDPREALAVYGEFQPDLTVLDLLMPHVDGFTIMEQIRKSDGDFFNIMVMTVQKDQDTKNRALEAGARDFLEKPFDLKEALERIRGLVELRLRYKRIHGQNISLQKKVDHLKKRSATAIARSGMAGKPPARRPRLVEIKKDGAFTLYDNGIVHDEKTGLEWFAGPDRNTTWDEAGQWVKNLSLEGGILRMPSLKELKGIYQQGNGVRNMTPLLKTTGWRVWAGETKGPTEAWRFGFAAGDDLLIARHGSNSLRAFAVRSRRP